MKCSPVLASRLVAILLVTACLLPLAAQGTVTPPPPEPATAYRDGDFLPHLFGTTDQAAFFAFGCAQMDDLPVSVAINFAGAAGEIASVLGEGSFGTGQPGFYVQADRRTWLWRIPQRAQALLPTLRPYDRSVLVAYVAGVNKSRLNWLANVNDLVHNTSPISLDLPTLTRLLSRPVSLHDVICHGIQMNGNGAMFGCQSLADAEQEDGQETLINNASNSWLVGESASASGNQVLLIDPHLGFQLEPQYRAYYAQITGPGISVCGISFPGWPCLAIGYNDTMAWSVTTNNPDSYDCYKAPMITTPGLPDAFPFDQGSKTVIRHPVTIQVWSDGANALVPETLQLAYAGHLDFPILREGNDKNGDESLWYGHASFTSAPCLWQTFIDLGRAANVLSAFNALADNAITFSNFLIGDNTGAKGYLWAGRVPIRGNPTPGTTWSQVQDGTSSNYQWQTIHPVSDLPFEYQGPVGITPPTSLQNDVWVQCNVRADRVRPVPTIDLDDYPDYMVHADSTPDSYRQLRASEMLRDGPGNFSMSDLEAISTDNLDLWWRAVRPLIPHVVRHSARRSDPQVWNMLQRLFSWNMRAHQQSPEAVMSLLMLGFYQRGLEKIESLGLHYRDADFTLPEQVPTPLAFATDPSWDYNRLAMEYAISQMTDYYPLLVNKNLPNVIFPGSPWTPTPWVGLPTNEAVLGHVKYVDLTPVSSPGDAAIYPAAGVISLYALFNQKQASPLDGLIENFGLLGDVGPFLNINADSGIHTALYVELGPTPHGRYLEALGPTEIADDPRRYANASDFVQGIYKDFECDETIIAADAVSMETVIYQPDPSVNDDGTSSTP